MGVSKRRWAVARLRQLERNDSCQLDVWGLCQRGGSLCEQLLASRTALCQAVVGFELARSKAAVRRVSKRRVG